MTSLPRDHFTATYQLQTGFTDCFFFLSAEPAEVIDVREVHNVAGTDGGSVNVMLRKCSGSQAPSAGVALLTTAFNLKATPNSPQSGTLTGTLNDRRLAPGDRLSADFSGVLTALANVVLVATLRPIAASVRGYASEAAPALFTAVERAFGGSLTIAQARTAITSALSGVDPSWATPQPSVWADLIDACNRILDCIEVNTHTNDRMRLWKTARAYLERVISNIAQEESGYRHDVGLSMSVAQVTDLNSLEAFIDRSVAENLILKFQ